jgi:hypothetical protein
MWFILQASIIFAVISSNIAWQWTPNGYLAALIGAGLAFGATMALNRLFRPGEKRRQNPRQRRI